MDKPFICENIHHSIVSAEILKCLWRRIGKCKPPWDFLLLYFLQIVSASMVSELKHHPRWFLTWLLPIAEVSTPVPDDSFICWSSTSPDFLQSLQEVTFKYCWVFLYIFSLPIFPPFSWAYVLIPQIIPQILSCMFGTQE